MSLPEIARLYTAILIGLLFFSLVFLVFKPKIPVFFYVFLILVCNSTKYGMEIPINTIYDRGGKISPVPLLNIFLFIMFLYLLIRGRVLKSEGGAQNLNRFPMLLFVIFAICYFLYGWISGIPFFELVDQYGIINIVNLILFSYVLSWVILSREDVRKITLLLMWAVGGLVMFGTARYFFWGGDPANIYSSLVNLRLTFFDIGYGAVFAIGLYYSSYMLMGGLCKSGKEKLLYSLVVLGTVFNIGLSFRRTAWVGLVFVFLWVFFNVKAGQKFLVLSMLVAALAIGGPALIQQRFSTQSKDGSIVKQMISDATDRRGNIQIRTGRFSELYSAYTTWQKNPIFGAGPWGSHASERKYGKHAYFVHNAFLHVLYKTGLVGLSLYVSIFTLYVVQWMRIRNRPWTDNSLKAFGEACFAGFLFLIPDLLFGTPTVIYRHSQIMGLVLTLPVIAFAVQERYEGSGRARTELQHEGRGL